MSLNLNKVILAGRLTRDPELRSTQTGTPMLSFTVAIDRNYVPQGQTERPSDFIYCIAWRQNAEFISKYFHKGSPICIEGNIQSRSFTDAQGQRRSSMEVVVDRANFVESAGSGQRQAPAAAQVQNEGVPFNPYVSGDASPAPAPASYGPKNEGFEELPDDDDLPF